MHPVLSYAIERQKDIIDFIGELVRSESPSDAPSSVNRFQDLLADRSKDIAEAEIFPSSRFGQHLKLRFKLSGAKKQGQILGLGHSDTVWPLGSLKDMPFREENGRLWGPGVLDMKAGLAFFIFAVRACHDLNLSVKRPVALLVVSDEEVGSETSRELTEREAAKSAAVLVLEPGTGLAGKLKTARKGVGAYTIRVKGRASHAGVDFSSGANAIVELARQIERVADFTDIRRGITVNPGVIRGGTRSNVVAAEAEAHIDIRVVKPGDVIRLDRKFRALKPYDGRCEVMVEGGLNRPPMERTRQVRALFRKARTLGKELGVKLEESATGGGSDGNFTAALGIPTLDGLGGVGEGAHAPHESIVIDRIADRTALLAGLLAEL
ncbi:MAG: M20 family metallopeptidase [Bryobacteraceae bacterium]